MYHKNLSSAIQVSRLKLHGENIGISNSAKEGTTSGMNIYQQILNKVRLHAPENIKKMHARILRSMTLVAYD
jgi:hypothetical protein